MNYIKFDEYFTYSSIYNNKKMPLIPISNFLLGSANSMLGPSQIIANVSAQYLFISSLAFGAIKRPHTKKLPGCIVLFGLSIAGNGYCFYLGHRVYRYKTVSYV